MWCGVAHERLVLPGPSVAILCRVANRRNDVVMVGSRIAAEEKRHLSEQSPSLVTEPPAALAFLGDGWTFANGAGHGACVAVSAIVDQHVCRLPNDRVEARRSALATLAWIDARLAQGLLVAGYIGYEVGAALELVGPGDTLTRPQARGSLGLAPAGYNVATAPGDANLPDAALYAFPSDALSPSQDLRSSRASEPLHRDLATTTQLPEDLRRQRADFIGAVRTALQAIAAGRYYQINVSSRFETGAAVGGVTLPLEDALRRLRAPQPVPFGMAVQVGETRYFSLSMERFLAVRPSASGGRIARSRPIKGTSARGLAPATDAAQRLALLASEKERAENTMIVDMVRNDLARVADMGGVRVTQLLEAVPYRTLWHLESEVQASLPQQTSATQLLQATLPPASVTGCPKVAAMTAIALLEGRRRGPYCGTLGVWHPDGRADLSVAIRGIAMRDTRAWLDVGAGIVADSRPEAEWEEICLKARAALRGLAAVADVPVGAAAAEIASVAAPGWG